ncbi:amino acid carrier protein [Corynebacterium sp. 3HC-13]|uniref:alanine/glycine:cation symporter family protein n=1 Tax=Corynebacterium poyangense TaxID=2684405 RepID=UPI001CCB8C53|nr:alanine/glycine:cation symporter family protein [Corynebacterium poyangense]MBZ8178083.1 amino acid carrier protein [Corynebacterium poyangense]
MATLESFLTNGINPFLWTWVVPIILILAGFYFGLRTLLVQIRMIPDMFRAVTERPVPHEGHSGEKDDQSISAFKAFSISAASRVGTGNVAGVAVAISLGGPGAVFWMWMIALLGGATAFVESTLAQLWKTKDGKAYRGGPAYYMTKGLNARWLAVIFGIAITITYGFVYNAVQTNSIVEAVSNSLDYDGMNLKIMVGIAVAALTAAIIFGGVQRIANATQVIVPFMAGAYLLIGVVVLILNAEKIPGMLADIIGSALGLREIAGATLGAAFSNGMRRGLFSNEAGQGSAPNAAATATVSHPVKQGLVQTLGVYFDTLLVCSITAFIILLSNPQFGADMKSATLTQDALAAEVGHWGIHFVTFILFILAFSSVIGNYYLAETNIMFFTESPTVLKLYRVVVLLCVFGGAIGTVPLVWALADTFSATMAIINLIAIVPLGGYAFKLLRNYSVQRSHGLDPVFHRSMLPEAKNVDCWEGDDPVTRDWEKGAKVL